MVLKNMKLVTVSLAIMAFAATSGTAQDNLENLADSASYAIGMNFASAQLQQALEQIEAQGFELNRDMVLAAIGDVLGGGTPRMPDSIAQSVLVTFQKQFNERQKAVDAEVGQENLKMGQEFLAENAKRSEVKTTASGLQYEVLKPGSGQSPDTNDVVQVHYKGTLLDGTVFDQSKADSPVEFPVNGVIPGWVEALQMMKPGAKWKLYIPSELAYGARRMGPDISPHSTLIFEVELLNVERK